MINPTFPQERRRRQRRCGARAEAAGNPPDINLDVGGCLRRLRVRRGQSIRALAEQSGLNVNTLSLIENGKTSPSVSTLQQLAAALGVPVTAFFEGESPKSEISYQKKGQRPKVAFSHGTLEDLGAGLTLQGGQPFLVTLEPKAGSGAMPIVHTGHELVFCLEGRLTYIIEEQVYPLETGDSLLFAAHLPHCWENPSETVTRSLLILSPADENDQPSERHFKPE